MRLIREFDPWKNSLCKCPPKYTFNPYTGCKFGCRYCYITSYIKDGFTPRIKDIDFYILESDIAKIARSRLPIALSLSTDAYQPLESRYRLTRRILKILSRYRIPTLITTKSTLLLRDLDILRDMNVAVSITITTLDHDIAEKLEPYAPRPSARLKAIKQLAENSIPVVVRIDPIIPSITDDLNDIGEAVKTFRDLGARHIVASIYKAKPDNLKRVIEAFPEFIEQYRKIYEKGKRIGGYRYPELNYSLKLLSQVRDLVKSAGLTFNTCRDGLAHLDTPGCYCDGSHLLIKPNL